AVGLEGERRRICQGRDVAVRELDALQRVDRALRHRLLARAAVETQRRRPVKFSVDLVAVQRLYSDVDIVTVAAQRPGEFLLLGGDDLDEVGRAQRKIRGTVDRLHAGVAVDLGKRRQGEER